MVAYKVHNARGSVAMRTIRIDKVLKEHQSTSETLLLLVSGDAVYEEADRKGTSGRSHRFCPDSAPAYL